MVPSDGREIVFAGAGILWGATTFYRGLSIVRARPKKKSSRKAQFPTTLVAAFVLTLACSAYLAWSVVDLQR